MWLLIIAIIVMLIGTIFAFYNKQRAKNAQNGAPAMPVQNPAYDASYQDNGWQFGVPAQSDPSNVDDSQWQFVSRIRPPMRAYNKARLWHRPRMRLHRFRRQWPMSHSMLRRTPLQLRRHPLHRQRLPRRSTHHSSASQDPDSPGRAVILLYSVHRAYQDISRPLQVNHLEGSIYILRLYFRPSYFLPLQRSFGTYPPAIWRLGNVFHRPLSTSATHLAVGRGYRMPNGGVVLNLSASS